MPSSANRLIIFAKYPEPGKVKTRLQPELSPEQSHQLYTAMAEDLTANLGRGKNFHTSIFFWPPQKNTEMASWLAPLAVAPQAEGDLGAKMKDAFERAFRAGAARAIVIGSDLPDLGEEDIEVALEALDMADLVLGPSDDGGFYLIALKKWHEGLFEGVFWSTETVLSQTLANARTLGLSNAQLPIRRDIDTAAEIRHLANQLQEKDPDLAGRIPRTAAVLSAWNGSMAP